MNLPRIIETDRLVLRPFEIRDLDGYVAYYTGSRTASPSGPPARHSVVEKFFAMAGQWALRGYGRYAVADGGTAFGHVGVLHQDHGPEMTWSLWDASREGKGLAYEAAAATLEAWQSAGGRLLTAQIDRENARSQALAARLGFRVDPTLAPPEHFPSAQVYLQGRAA